MKEDGMRSPFGFTLRFIAVLAVLFATSAESADLPTKKPGLPASPIAPKTAPPQKLSPAILVSPEAQNLVATGAGRYEVTGVDFHITGATAFTGYQESTQPNTVDSPNHSVITVRGTVHGNGILETNGEPAHVFHVMFKGWDMFPGLPATCSAQVVPFPQPSAYSRNYVAFYVIKDTASKPECWGYFRNLRTLEIEVLAIKLYPHPNIPALPVSDGGKRVLTLGTLKPK
jgi:hypothetical protein